MERSDDPRQPPCIRVPVERGGRDQEEAHIRRHLLQGERRTRVVCLDHERPSAGRRDLLGPAGVAGHADDLVVLSDETARQAETRVPAAGDQRPHPSLAASSASSNVRKFWTME